MADFLLGESISEQIRICPYENNHRIKLKSMEAHLEKCRGRNLPKKYMKCPYNPNHVKFVEEMELHLEICPDMLIFGTRDGIDEEVGQKVNCIIEHRDVQGEEDWEDANENPVTYDPLLRLEETRFQPKNIKKRYEKIYHPDAQVVLTSTSKIKNEPADSLSHLEKAYWEERDSDQGFPHVHQWLQDVPEPTANSAPYMKEEDQDEVPSSQTDDAGNPKRARLFSGTGTARGSDMAYHCPQSSDHAGPRFVKDEKITRSSQMQPNTHAINSYDDDFAALNGARTFRPVDNKAIFNLDEPEEPYGVCSSTTHPGDEEFAALNQVPKFFSSAGRKIN